MQGSNAHRDWGKAALSAACAHQPLKHKQANGVCPVSQPSPPASGPSRHCLGRVNSCAQQDLEKFPEKQLDGSTPLRALICIQDSFLTFVFLKATPFI